MAKIAIEESLSDVKNALQNAGHEVTALDQSNASSCDCCVISGMDKNLLGMAETSTKSAVINADGQTPEQVLQEVNQRLQLS